jgi:hypothetical protein
MSIFSRPVSEIYHADEPSHQIIDGDASGIYEAWGYTRGYEVDQAGKNVPEGGNTAIFRIPANAMTEPVYVTKPEPGSEFKVNVLAGTGAAILAKSDGSARLGRLNEDDQLRIRPGWAYSYVNTGETDLILHGTAMPAFRLGDDVELTRSIILPKGYGPGPRGDDAYTYILKEGKVKEVILPAAFFDYIGEAAAGRFKAY